MSGKYKYVGITKELHQRLVVEFNALKEQYRRTFTKHIMETKQCDRLHARRYFTRFYNVVKENSNLSPMTLDVMREYISVGLANDLQAYLYEHYTGSRGACRQEIDNTNAGLTEELFKQYCDEVEAIRSEHPNCITDYIMEVKGCSYNEATSIRTAINKVYTEQGILTPRKVIQLEGLLSRELFSKISKFVFNKYEWSESLDEEVDRISLEYHKKGKVGRDKASVKKYLYKAISMGL